MNAFQRTTYHWAGCTGIVFGLAGIYAVHKWPLDSTWPWILAFGALPLVLGILFVWRSRAFDPDE